MEKAVLFNADVDLEGALKRSSFGVDAMYIEVKKRAGVDLGYAVAAVDRWLAWVAENFQRKTHEWGDQASFRLFYNDALFERLVLRYSCWSIEDQPRWALCIATVNVFPPWQGKKAFKRLLDEVETRADALALDVVVESARPFLGTMLARREQGKRYVPLRNRETINPLQSLNANTWVRSFSGEPKTTVYATLPSDVVAMLDPFHPHEESVVLRIAAEEVAAMADRVRARIKAELP